jgi:hypothetical protein
MQDDPKSLSESEKDIPPPTGTVFVMTLYILALCGMWGFMYLRLITR